MIIRSTCKKDISEKLCVAFAWLTGPFPWYVVKWLEPWSIRRLVLDACNFSKAGSVEALCYVLRPLYTFLQHFSNEQIGCPWVPWDRFWDEGSSWETMKKYGFCYASRMQCKYVIKKMRWRVTHYPFVHREIGCQTEQVHGIRLKFHWPDGLEVWFVVREFIVSRRFLI